MVVKSNIITITVKKPSISYKITLTAAKYTISENIPDTVYAKVVDQNNNPVANLNVKLVDLTTGATTSSYTNAEGIAIFTVKFVSAGTYQLQADVA